MADGQVSGATQPIIQDPIVVDAPTEAHWDAAADVLVVGFGGAGACAAIEATDLGSRVIILDRFDGGGATAYSGGVHYAGGTGVQERAGVEDSAEEMLKYLRLETGDAVSDATLRQFCEDSRKNIEWLEELGVEFGGGAHTGKTVYPPDGKYLYYSGNEPLPAYADKARPAVRGHRVVGKGYTGHIYFGVLRNAVEQRGIPVRRHTRVTSLIVDRAGRVIGVEALELAAEDHATHGKLYAKAMPMPFTFDKAERAIVSARELEVGKGRRIRIRAREGVILATGGFCFNLDMLKQHMPLYASFAPAMLRMGSMGCDGSGIQLGESVGGAAKKLANNFYGRIISPPSAFVEGIVVNRQGRRFYNEDAYNAELGGAIAEQQDGAAWLILDRDTWKKLWKELLPKGDGQFMQWYLPAIGNVMFGGSKKGRTIAALARKCDIDPAGLEAEIQSTREAMAAGNGDPVGKSANYFRAVGDGPYHAINLSVSNKLALAPFLTLGGLAVSEDSSEVLDQQGKPIKGLYAIGRAAVGICANRYMSGMSLADGVFAARRAARHVAKAVAPAQAKAPAGGAKG